MDSQTSSVEAARLDALLLKTSRTFALSIPVLPEPTRAEVTVAYLLFRIADTLEDATRWEPERQAEELDRFARLLEDRSVIPVGELAREWAEAPPLDNEAYLELLAELPAVLAALDRLDPEARELVCRYTRRTAERMILFVRRPRPLQLRDVQDLRDYCYAVAGIVGEMLTELFLLGRPQLAEAAGPMRADAARFGEALQLVNILKDSAFDRDEGRRYLPADAGRSEVFALARGDLDTAEAYVGRLQQYGAPRGLIAFTALPVLLARRTLDRVEAEGPGAKLTRLEVATIVAALDAALSAGKAAV
jgi:farnesyl-diphosphate farnesyltransferase